MRSCDADRSQRGRGSDRRGGGGGGQVSEGTDRNLIRDLAGLAGLANSLAGGQQQGTVLGTGA